MEILSARMLKSNEIFVIFEDGFFLNNPINIFILNLIKNKYDVNSHFTKFNSNYMSDY